HRRERGDHARARGVDPRDHLRAGGAGTAVAGQDVTLPVSRADEPGAALRAVPLRPVSAVGAAGLEADRDFGRRAYFARDILRALGESRSWGVETIRQMRSIGVGSIPLVLIVAAFLGGVTAFQTRYQLFGGVQLSVVGLIARQSIVLELGPLLTGLV